MWYKVFEEKKFKNKIITDNVTIFKLSKQLFAYKIRRVFQHQESNQNH